MDNYDEETVEETIETPEEETEVVEVEEVEETDDTEQPEEEDVDWKARALKAEQAIIKAKTKVHKEVPQKKTDSKLSTFDLLALQRANIETEEDLEEVTRWAGYNNISVAEALKSSILKATLAEKAEQRNSAMAVNTGSSRRASSQVSDERILADAEKGILPDSDADLARLTRLRLARK